MPDTLEFYFAIVGKARSAKARGSSRDHRGAPALRACKNEWEIEIPAFRCPTAAAAQVEVASGNEFEVESIEVEEAACIAPR